MDEHTCLGTPNKGRLSQCLGMVGNLSFLLYFSSVFSKVIFHAATIRQESPGKPKADVRSISISLLSLFPSLLLRYAL